MDICYPWHLLDANACLLERMEAKPLKIEGSTINGKVFMEEGAKVIDSFIDGPCFIGKNSVVGPHAIVKGPVSIGENCAVGGSSTVKNSILFDGVRAKHLSYIGDSVLGSDVNLGSGTQLANFRFDGGTVEVQTENGLVSSGRSKLGAIVGDKTKFGVLSMSMPGKLIGENCWVGSGVIVNRNIPPNTHVLLKQELSEFTLRSKKENGIKRHQ